LNFKTKQTTSLNFQNRLNYLALRLLREAFYPVLGIVCFSFLLAFIGKKLESWNKQPVIELTFEKLKSLVRNELKAEKHTKSSFSSFWHAEKLRI
jgi:hypothetical protein